MTMPRKPFFGTPISSSRQLSGICTPEALAYFTEMLEGLALIFSVQDIERRFRRNKGLIGLDEARLIIARDTDMPKGKLCDFPVMKDEKTGNLVPCNALVPAYVGVIIKSDGSFLTWKDETFILRGFAMARKFVERGTPFLVQGYCARHMEILLEELHKLGQKVYATPWATAEERADLFTEKIGQRKSAKRLAREQEREALHAQLEQAGFGQVHGRLDAAKLAAKEASEFKAQQERLRKRFEEAVAKKTAAAPQKEEAGTALAVNNPILAAIAAAKATSGAKSEK